MRKLKTPDLFAFIRTLKNIGIKDEIKVLAKKEKNIKDAWSKGYELIWNILDKATEKKAEKHIYEFLSGPFELSAAEIEDLDISVLFDMLKQLAEENDLVGFFERAEDMMK